MSLFIDCQFVDSISHLLRNFKRKADLTWNFSCPICGDSKKNKLKARGYFIRAKSKDGSSLDALSFKCHNCGCSMHFGDFLKTLDADLHKQYVLQTFKEGGTKVKKKVEKMKKKDYTPPKPTALIGCPSIASLGPDHIARQYIEGRKIPEDFWKQLFWTDDFPALVKRVAPENEYPLRKEGRVVIPFLDRNFALLAIQGRTLDPNASVRYLTVKTFEDAPKIYGMHRLGAVWKRIYIVEGPFDSMFLPNCLAMAGSDIPPSLPRDKVVIVYDNEPTKQDTREKMEKAIESGYRVCIWPSTIQESDINKMILAGYTADYIREVIDKNSYTGLEAKGKFGTWNQKPRPTTTPNRKDNEL